MREAALNAGEASKGSIHFLPTMTGSRSLGSADVARRSKVRKREHDEANMSTPTARQRLANRRPSSTFAVECNGLQYTCTFSRYGDGRIGEIFLTNTKPSSQSDVNARDAAVAASLAFQHGCSVDELRRALLHDAHGNASSPLGAALDKIGDVP